MRDDREALRGMLESHIARGTADEAAEVLERVLETNEEDKELVTMLARAYLEAEDPKGAERATSLLMAQNASNYTQFLPVTRLYLKTGEVHEVVRILSTIIEKFKGGPVGITTIATAVGEETGTLEEVYEPFLIQEGFLQRTPRGREVTHKAYEHLGKKRPGREGEQMLF